MGNCCLKGSRSSTMVWAETSDENDQWVYYSEPDLQQKQSLLSDPVSVNEIREVKIMMSKKKLEELLGKINEDVHNIPVNQILDCLLDSSDRFQIDDHLHHQQQPSWKPCLQSIPEEN